MDRRSFLKGALFTAAATQVPAVPVKKILTPEWEKVYTFQFTIEKISVPFRPVRHFPFNRRMVITDAGHTVMLENLPIEETLKILEEYYMKFWIIADGTKQGKVDAEDADDAMEVWLEQNGFESIDEACDEFLIDYDDFEVIPA